MGTVVRYYPGGYQAGALQQNRAEFYDGAAGTFTSWDTAGVQTASRALSGVEVASLAAQDTMATGDANKATIQANIATHIGQLETWLTANPNGAVLTAGQTKFVAQTLIGVGRLLLGMTSSVGGAT
jgi:hypothetical protein